MPNEKMESRRKRGPSPEKAKKMLADDSANGQPLSQAQKGFFGAIAGGDSTGASKSRKRRKKKAY